jgi:hypothetical protein
MLNGNQFEILSKISQETLAEMVGRQSELQMAIRYFPSPGCCFSADGRGGILGSPGRENCVASPL